MSNKRKTIDWDGVAAAYNEGSETLKEIGARFNVSAGGISHRARREGWPARHRSTKRKRQTGATFEWRLARALDKQIHELETRWSDEDKIPDAASAEKEARTLNVLIRTAEKLKELEMTPQPKAKGRTPRDGQESRTDQLDRKRLRQTLERRLDQLIAAADARGLPGKPDENGN